MIESFGKTQYFTEGLGGLLGNLIYQNLFKETLGVFGTILLLGTTYIVGFVFIIVRDLGVEFTPLPEGIARTVRWMADSGRI